MRKRWVPGPLSRWDTRTLTWVLIFSACLRAFDYFTGSDTDVASLSVVEEAAPLWAWGTAVSGGTAVLVAGVLTRTHLVVWLGYVILAATYVGLTIGAVLAAGHMPWWDGIRGAGPLLVVLSLHALLALRTGVSPIEHERSRPVETTVAGPDAATAG